MSRVQNLRLFVSQRLNAAVEEICAALEQTIVKYEQEAALCQEVISRQHALLCALHKPHMEKSSTDAFTEQLMVGQRPVHPSHQDEQNLEPSQVGEEQKGKRPSDPEEADIIQVTYSDQCASKPGEEPCRSLSEPAPAGPHQDVQLVLSSETEDSDDYSKDSAEPRSALDKPNPKMTCRPGLLRCRVCGWTSTATTFFIRHIKTHLQEPGHVCGVCGERFRTADGLRSHIQTHQSPRRRREPQNRTRTPSSESLLHQHSSPNPMDCEDGGNHEGKTRTR